MERLGDFKLGMGVVTVIKADKDWSVSSAHHYISPISSIVFDSELSLQQYVGDTQLYISVSVDDLAVNLSTLESCL